MERLNFQTYVVGQLGKLDELPRLCEKVEQLERRVAGLDGKVDQLDAKVDALEKFEVRIRTQAGVVAAIVGTIVSVLTAIATTLIGRIKG